MKLPSCRIVHYELEYFCDLSRIVFLGILFYLLSLLSFITLSTIQGSTMRPKRHAMNDHYAIRHGDYVLITHEGPIAFVFEILFALTKR